MQVTVEKNDIVIRIPKNPKPVLSSTEKTFQVASSHGNMPTNVQIDDQPLVVGVNCYIRNKDYKKPTS